MQQLCTEIIFFCGIFLKESLQKALSQRLEIKNFENSPFLTLADTLRHTMYILREIHFFFRKIILDTFS